MNLAYVATLPCETLMSENKRLTINYKVANFETLMSENKRLKIKKQGSVATYFRCGETVNSHVKRGLLLSLPVKNN